MDILYSQGGSRVGIVPSSKSSRKDSKQSSLVVRDSIQDVGKITIVRGPDNTNMFSCGSKVYTCTINFDIIHQVEVFNVWLVLG